LTYPEEYPGEIALVGAAIGGGFTNTTELHVRNFEEAMSSPDRAQVEKAIKEEHDRMIKSKVFKPVPRSSVDKKDLINSTWSIKKKLDGTYGARMVARGFKQIDGIHYHEDNKSAPVVNDMTIQIVFVLAVLAKWYMEVLDIKGAFLHGEFEDGERIYMEIPKGFERFYASNLVLLLLTTLYGLKQGALAFWRKLVLTMKANSLNRSKADPCLYYKWDANGLSVVISVTDDMNLAGKKPSVLEIKEGITRLWDCDEVGETKEYMGLNVDYRPADGFMKLTRPMLIQSLADEFPVPEDEAIAMPGVPGDVLEQEESDLTREEQRVYRSGVGKLMHLARWTRVESANAIRELTKFVGAASKTHVAAMYRAMRALLNTPNRGLLLQPFGEWDGVDRNFLFKISGRSDAAYFKKGAYGVSGYTTFLQGAPINSKCVGQRYATLSLAESELGAATSCVQDMLFAMRVLESMGLSVKKPMVLEVDNKGAIDWVNSWSIGGRMRHIDVRHAFLRDLREDGILVVRWIAGPDNSSDLLTKNLPGPLFEKHASVFCGVDEYMQYEQQAAAGAAAKTVRGKGAGTCFGSGPELGFEPSQKATVGTTVVTPKLVPPNANAEGSAIKGSEDKDSKE
jgi:hypothetical protein